MERGKIDISAHMIKELALLYHVSSDYILELSDEERTSGRLPMIQTKKDP